MADNTNVENINVEAIMAEIRTNIKESGADQIPLTFADQAPATAVPTGANKLNDAVQFISYNYELQPYQVFTGNPVKVFIKKAIRKIANFFVIPIVVQQNAVNTNFMIVSEAVRDQQEEIELMKKTLAELNAKIDKLSK